MRKRLLIADDHELMLAGVSQLLAPESEIVGVVRNGRALVEEAQRLAPEIVVVDIGMPGLNGIDAAREIAAAMPTIRIVILTQQLSPNHVQAAFRAGAHGFVAKQAAATELIDAIRAVCQGRFFVTPLAVPKDPGRFEGGAVDTNPEEFFGVPLTPRQREVLRLVAQGKAAKEIATAMNITVRTVDFHKSVLMDELGLRTTAELTRYAMANGLLSE